MNDGVIQLPPITMPINLEIEHQLLGAILMKNKYFAEVAGFLEPWHFALESHQKIFAIVKSMIERGQVANPLTIKNALTNLESFEELGGAKYLTALCGSTASFMNVADYGRCIVDCAFRREIIGNAADAIQAAVEGGAPAEEIAATNIARMGKLNIPNQGMINLESAIDEVVFELEHPELLKCYPTGMKRVDAMLGGGLYAGKFYGLGARHKVGKTNFMLSLSYSLLFGRTDPVPHLYICMEMGAKEISQRLLARAIGVNSETFLEIILKREAYVRGKWTTHQEMAEQVKLAKLEMQDRGLTFQQRPRLSLDALKATIASAAMSGKYKGIIVDFIQLVTGRGARQTMAEHLDDVAQTLVETAKQYGMWVMAAAQLNREGLVRGGDGLMNACDMSLNLFRKPDGGGGYENDAWIEMAATRFTPSRHLGTEKDPGLTMETRTGPFFREFESNAGVDEL